MNNVFTWQVVSAGNLCFSRLTTVQRSAFSQKLGTGGAVNRTVYASAAEQAVICSIYDCFQIIHFRNVSLDYLYNTSHLLSLRGPLFQGTNPPYKRKIAATIDLTPNSDGIPSFRIYHSMSLIGFQQFYLSFIFLRNRIESVFTMHNRIKRNVKLIQISLHAERMSIHRLDPLHKGELPGITNCADREYSLHQEQGSSKHHQLNQRKMVRNLTEYTYLIEDAAHSHAA